MVSRASRTAVMLVVAACLLWGCLRGTQAQPPQPASPFPGSAGAPSPSSVVVYSQPPSPEGGILQSSLRDPDGSASDTWVWDGFAFGWDQAITEVRWRGGYDPGRRGSLLPVAGFTLSIYASIPSGAQPDLAHPPLLRYEVGNNAAETPAEVLGGVQTCDYRYTLPAPFQAAAHTKYWVQIEALQPGVPDWGLAAASRGDGQYFRRIAGEGSNWQLVAGDAAFALLGPYQAGGRVFLPQASRGGGASPSLPPMRNELSILVRANHGGSE